MKRRLKRILARWECEALELQAEHKGAVPVHYWLHQTKHHYKKTRHNAGTEFERAYLFRQRDYLLSLLSVYYPSHLYKDTISLCEYKTVVCIHLPGGQIAFHVSEESTKERFSHLKMESKDDWDGTGAPTREARIEEEVALILDQPKITEEVER